MSEYFVKYNQVSFKDALVKEAEGLELLREQIEKHNISELRVPKIISVNERELILENINTVSPSATQMAQLGSGLAKLHQIHIGEHFGLSQNNYIGLNAQKNTLTQDWGSFFTEHRLGYQISLITKTELREKFEKKLKQKRSALIEFLNTHCRKPSLCHGDLWSGNALFSKQYCWLIDPAAYYGDREVDIAMSEMFGGFTQAFYQAYNAEYSLSEQYPYKKHLYNLYHYLNHYNLFGKAYLPNCETGFNQLTDIPH